MEDRRLAPPFSGGRHCSGAGTTLAEITLELLAAPFQRRAPLCTVIFATPPPSNFDSGPDIVSDDPEPGRTAEYFASVF